MENGSLAFYKEPPLQDPREHAAFIQILVDEGARSYLEIGAMHGRSLWRVAMAMPPGSRLVAVDSMVDRPSAKDSLVACIAELRALGFDAHFIFGDSTTDLTINQVRPLGPFDALFIDGNHSPEFVIADWHNYGPMARIVGFHDINWNNTWVSGKLHKTPDETKMGAPKIWNAVKQGHRYKEFKFHPPQNYYGIGVLWRE